MLRVFTLALLISSALTHAQDAPAPTLETRSDETGDPWWAIAASADAVGVAFGDYQLRIDLGLSRYHGIAVSPGWRRSEGHGPMLGLAYEVWPLGRGLDGLSILVSGEVAWLPEQDRVDLALGAELGYQIVWKGLLLGISAGVERRYRFASQRTGKIAPIVRVQLGWAWS